MPAPPLEFPPLSLATNVSSAPLSSPADCSGVCGDGKCDSKCGAQALEFCEKGPKTFWLFTDRISDVDWPAETNQCCHFISSLKVTFRSMYSCATSFDRWST